MRKPNAFEMIVFIIGLFFIAISYVSIQNLLNSYGFSWEALIAIFLWIVIVIFIIALAVMENMKEELRTIIHIGTQETRLTREEINLLRKDIKYKK